VVPCIPGARELCTQGFKSGGLDNNRRAFSPAVRMSPTVSATWQDLLFDPQTSGGLLMALPEAAAIEMRRKLMNERQMDIAVIGKAAVKDKRDAWILVR